MGSRRLEWLLVLGSAAAILVAGLGLRSLQAERSGARARYLQRLSLLAQGLVRSLGEVGEEGLAFRSDDEGNLLEPILPELPRVEPDLRARRQALTSEIDRLDRAGDGRASEARLAELAQDAEQPALAAWAASWRAARAPEALAARAAWQGVLERFGALPSDSGLTYALVAQRELARLAGDPPQQLAALVRELATTRGRLADRARGSLALELLERLEAQGEAGLAKELRSELRAAWERLALLESFRLGLSDWIAAGAPGGRGSFPLAQDSLAPTRAEKLVATALPADDGFRGRMLGYAALARALLARGEADTWRELALDACVEDAAGHVLAGEPPPAGAPSVLERAPAPLGELAVRVYGSDYPAFEAAERRRFQRAVALGAGALLAALAAAFATWRALRRELALAHQREQFVSAVTHELKSPLASIRLLAELVGRGDLERERLEDFSRRTVREVDRLTRLIDAVLRYARLSDGRADPLAQSEHELAELVREAVQTIEPLVRERGFELVVRATAGGRVRGERDALVGAIAELVDNASKYGGAGGAIEIVLERRGGALALRVLDRGPGVPREAEELVFEPFRRLEEESTRSRQGVGLGLALVRAVARAHGGEARCAAREGGGSSFTLELPEARA